jgi:hypothetical protein
MIDKEFIVDFLEDDKKKISTGDIIPHDVFTYLRRFSINNKTKVRMLFAKGATNLSFVCHCFKCKEPTRWWHPEIADVEWLLKHLQSDLNTFVCSACRRKEEDEERDSVNKRTQQFINLFLHPEGKWKLNKSEWFKAICTGWSYCNPVVLSHHIKCMSYPDFLLTPYWKAVAYQNKVSAGFKCILCNSSDKIATHHRSYDHHGEEHLYMKDLVCLCGECHSKFHDK